MYGNTCVKYLNKLVILNNKILRILQHAPLDTPVLQLYATYHSSITWLKRNLQILKFVHNFIHHQQKLPCIFSSYFTQNTTFHPYNTRAKDSLHYETYRTTMGQRSIKYKGSMLWNCLPEERKDFIDKLKEFLIDKWHCYQWLACMPNCYILLCSYYFCCCQFIIINMHIFCDSILFCLWQLVQFLF